MTPFLNDRYKTCLIALFLVLAPTAASADSVEDIFQPYAGLLADFVVERDLPVDGLVTSFDYRAALDQSITAYRR